MSEVRIGGVTVRFNEDGTLYIYQPDSNRNLSSELAEDLAVFLLQHVRLYAGEQPGQAEFSATLTDTEIEADKNVFEAELMASIVNLDTPRPEDVPVSNGATKATPVKRRPGRPRKAQS